MSQMNKVRISTKQTAFTTYIINIINTVLVIATCVLTVRASTILYILSSLSHASTLSGL